MELEEFSSSKSEIDIYTIDHKKRVFTNGIDSFKEKSIIPVGVFEQRVGWPRESEDGSKVKMIPICVSPNNVNGFRTPYGKNNSDLPESGLCETCAYRNWHKGKQSCGKVYFVVAFPTVPGNSLDLPIVLRMNRSAGSAVKGFFAKIPKDRQPYMYETKISLNVQGRDNTQYCVPAFTTPVVQTYFTNSLSMDIYIANMFDKLKNAIEQGALPAPERSGSLTPMSMGT